MHALLLRCSPSARGRERRVARGCCACGRVRRAGGPGRTAARTIWRIYRATAPYLGRLEGDTRVATPCWISHLALWTGASPRRRAGAARGLRARLGVAQKPRRLRCSGGMRSSLHGSASPSHSCSRICTARRPIRPRYTQHARHAAADAGVTAVADGVVTYACSHACTPGV